MPPQRTAVPMKPQKTERTHEENQERAYIAASRRSDRSLEARMESARRASDIHKKRTGRALRVTEKDVENEEMYEEEDEDLEAQMRRLTSHIQTNDISFNRRLQALLATQMTMRMAVNGMNNSGYTNAAGFAPPYMQNMATLQQNYQNMQQEMQGQHMQSMPNAPQANYQNMHNMQYAQNMQTVSPQMMAPPARQHSFRQSPYPAARQPSYHHRAGSVASGGQGSPYTPNHSSPSAQVMNHMEEQRRLSHSASQRPTLSRHSSNAHSVKTESPSLSPSTYQQTPSPPLQHAPKAVTQNSRLHNIFNSMPNIPTPTEQSNISPLTATLPVESQDILASSFNPNHPMTSVFMGSLYNQQDFLGYDDLSKHHSVDSGYNGMNPTLAPAMPSMSALDTSGQIFGGEPQSATTMASAATDDFPSFSPQDAQLFENWDASLSRNNSEQGSQDFGEWSETFFDFNGSSAQ